MVNKSLVDIKENDIIEFDSQLLPILLKDNSSKRNIIWATDNYVQYGSAYTNKEEITPNLISGNNGNIIKPRSKRTNSEQQLRVRTNAEVFTPGWMCNRQNNLIDNAWFVSENIFNVEIEKGWKTKFNKITFPTSEGKSWQDYLRNVCLEVACGEAPYLVSRYDTVTGKPIPVLNRIGLLDRKLRVVSENIETEAEWYAWAKIAFQSVYGYEWQGDNLLLARENLLCTFMDYYKDKFNKIPAIKHLIEIAKIISWNIWQMDGLKGVIPNSCREQIVSIDMFGESEFKSCEGCKNNNYQKHNGIQCLIKDWNTGETLKYNSMLKR
ncbi:hypothetical protein M2459_002139 [Parabacteroides sp. PF5-5]|uniref:restriction endonuclease subunit M n=1 Tax=unclassified Parabacteroides TaxID=2649774 RepID=UPI002473BF1A|nr:MULTISPECIES: restriction endonuclease subunit M [unclassified Parabacteroides]MDH6306844.1 hypothetical protein [Parabacteroides sp. PH5-39]MDH6316290.1 hypothetical protein [Parabacteroides sp. PF5-13]MDH6319773.1 hypothetical protein [Parabacteroides sp. PH5-13]MDH6323636.1 hypothetical protein [Parabacteroides sp. PH5-8]MDH6327477.1 hypothetical protein [Parabacteroides sp. PH5-41]